MDQKVHGLEERHAPHMNCRPGCSSCCTLSSVLPVEAAVIRHALEKLDHSQRIILREGKGKTGEYCPLLVNGLCSIYRDRPIICRTHGIPVGYVDYQNEIIEVSACRKNFTGEHSFEKEDFLLMDEIIRQLQVLNRSFSDRESRQTRIAISDLVK
jgi:Fe-S-cluster containining protein